jgi:hypothetical protein
LEALGKADKNYHVDQMKMKHFGIGIFISESENEKKKQTIKTYKQELQQPQSLTEQKKPEMKPRHCQCWQV